MTCNILPPSSPPPSQKCRSAYFSLFQFPDLARSKIQMNDLVLVHMCHFIEWTKTYHA